MSARRVGRKGKCVRHPEACHRAVPRLDLVRPNCARSHGQWSGVRGARAALPSGAPGGGGDGWEGRRRPPPSRWECKGGGGIQREREGRGGGREDAGGGPHRTCGRRRKHQLWWGHCAEFGRCRPQVAAVHRSKFRPRTCALRHAVVAVAPVPEMHSDFISEAPCD